MTVSEQRVTERDSPRSVEELRASCDNPSKAYRLGFSDALDKITELLREHHDLKAVMLQLLAAGEGYTEREAARLEGEMRAVRDLLGNPPSNGSLEVIERGGRETSEI